MELMFSECISLTVLDLSNFNINNVNNINGMFLNLNKNCNIFTKDQKILNELIKFIY